MKLKVLDERYRSLLETIREHFHEAKQSIWDKRNKIKIVHFGDKEITVKLFKTPHMINKLAYTFIRPSKAARSYENSLRIKAFVPLPIGYVEYKKFGLIHDSYFVSEHYNYDFTIREPLSQKEFPDKEAILEQFAHFTYRLHEAGVEHLDYSPGNILIKQISKDQYECKVIDVNRMKFRDLTMQERLENFAKLWADDEDLSIIIGAYTQMCGWERAKAIEIACKASQQHKEKTNFKKKLKGKKVVSS